MTNLVIHSWKAVVFNYRVKGFSRFVCLFIYLLLFFFVGPQVYHMEVPKLEVGSQLQLLASTPVHGNTRSLTH